VLTPPTNAHHCHYAQALRSTKLIELSTGSGSLSFRKTAHVFVHSRLVLRSSAVDSHQDTFLETGVYLGGKTRVHTLPPCAQALAGEGGVPLANCSTNWTHSPTEAPASIRLSTSASKPEWNWSSFDASANAHRTLFSASSSPVSPRPRLMEVGSDFKRFKATVSSVSISFPSICTSLAGPAIAQTRSLSRLSLIPMRAIWKTTQTKVN